VPKVGNAKNYSRFADIEAGSWYERYMIMAERYGIVSPAPGTKLLKPDDPINRAQFLKMLALTFGVEQNLPHLYRDVATTAWYSPFAGIAEEYGLFPQSDPGKLHPDTPLTHSEAAYAVQKILDAREEGTLKADPKVPAQQSALKLKLYLIISNTQEEVTLVRPPVREKVPPTPPPAYTFARNIPLLRGDIIRLVNDERGEEGLSSLTINTALVYSAQRYAEDMAHRSFFGHTNPEGKTLKERVEGSGFFDPLYSATCPSPRSVGGGDGCVRKFILGENIARGQKTIQEVMAAWLNSPSHRNAILHPEFREIGIGISAGVWVQHFAGTSE
jgi:uncharacterized protein YkwD